MPSPFSPPFDAPFLTVVEERGDFSWVLIPCINAQRLAQLIPPTTTNAWLLRHRIIGLEEQAAQLAAAMLPATSPSAFVVIEGLNATVSLPIDRFVSHMRSFIRDGCDVVFARRACPRNLHSSHIVDHFHSKVFSAALCSMCICRMKERPAWLWPQIELSWKQPLRLTSVRNVLWCCDGGPITGR